MSNAQNEQSLHNEQIQVIMYAGSTRSSKMVGGMVGQAWNQRMQMPRICSHGKVNNQNQAGEEKPREHHQMHTHNTEGVGDRQAWKKVKNVWKWQVKQRGRNGGVQNAQNMQKNVQGKWHQTEQQRMGNGIIYE